MRSRAFKSLQKTAFGILVASGVSLCMSPDGFAACKEKVFWSSATPLHSLVLQRSGDQVKIRSCTLDLREIKEGSRVVDYSKDFANSVCVPIDPETPTYSQAQLDKDTEYLVHTARVDRAKGVRDDALMGFYIQVGGAVLGQGIAKVVGVTGSGMVKGAQKIHPAAGCSARVVLWGLGLFRRLDEGSNLVARDKMLRFFPGYIGLGAGTLWSLYNEHRFHEHENKIKSAKSLASTGAESEDGCEPQEIEMRMDQFIDKVRDALSLARRHQEDIIIENSRGGPMTIEEKKRKALESAPTGHPQ
jgi:hypothetical protein